MSAPIDLYVYPDEAHDVPVEAWRDGEPEATIRYLRADLTCGECKNSNSQTSCIHHWGRKDWSHLPACMEFSPR